MSLIQVGRDWASDNKAWLITCCVCFVLGILVAEWLF
jgi:hypothetical protein